MTDASHACEAYVLGDHDLADVVARVGLDATLSGVIDAACHRVMRLRDVEGRVLVVHVREVEDAFLRHLGLRTHLSSEDSDAATVIRRLLSVVGGHVRTGAGAGWHEVRGGGMTTREIVAWYAANPLPPMEESEDGNSAAPARTDGVDVTVADALASLPHAPHELAPLRMRLGRPPGRLNLDGDDRSV